MRVACNRLLADLSRVMADQRKLLLNRVQPSQCHAAILLLDIDSDEMAAESARYQ